MILNMVGCGNFLKDLEEGVDMTNDLKRLRRILGRIDVPSFDVIPVEDYDNGSFARAMELNDEVGRDLEIGFERMRDSFETDVNKKRRKKK